MDISLERVGTPRTPWVRAVAVLALVGVLLALMVAALVSSQRRLPLPFGPALNGGIPYMIDGDLYVGNVETGTTRLLLGGPEFDFDPVYSRDGTRILFGRRADPTKADPYHLMVMAEDGSGLREVTTEAVVAPIWWDWSPDGKHVVLVDDRSGMNFFELLDPNGQTPAIRLAEGIGVDVPVFRPPDGAEIMFRGQSGAKIGIYVVDAAGGDPRPLVAPSLSSNSSYTLREPRYSPDGTQVAYHRWDEAKGVMRLYVMDADGSNPRELAADADIWFTGWPVWSNDGTRVAVQRGRVATDGTDGFDMPYAIVDVRTGTVTETGEPPSCCRIEWAPDDSSLLFLQDVDGVSRQVLLDPDGGPSTTLPWTSDSYPNWQRVAP